jgi:hypothetical protein
MNLEYLITEFKNKISFVLFCEECVWKFEEDIYSVHVLISKYDFGNKKCVSNAVSVYMLLKYVCVYVVKLDVEVCVCVSAWCGRKERSKFKYLKEKCVHVNECVCVLYGCVCDKCVY